MDEAEEEGDDDREFEVELCRGDMGSFPGVMWLLLFQCLIEPDGDFPFG